MPDTRSYFEYAKRMDAARIHAAKRAKKYVYGNKMTNEDRVGVENRTEPTKSFKEYETSLSKRGRSKRGRKYGRK